MRPAMLLQSAGWLALVAMLLLSSPGVSVNRDADAARVAAQEAPIGR